MKKSVTTAGRKRGRVRRKNRRQIYPWPPTPSAKPVSDAASIGSLLAAKSAGAEQKKRAYIHTNHQSVGVDYAKKLGVKKNQYGRIIKAVKENPSLAQRAFSFVVDANNVHDPIKYFFWQFNQLKRDQPV